MLFPYLSATFKGFTRSSAYRTPYLLRFGYVCGLYDIFMSGCGNYQISFHAFKVWFITSQLITWQPILT